MNEKNPYHSFHALHKYRDEVNNNKIENWIEKYSYREKFPSPLPHRIIFLLGENVNEDEKAKKKIEKTQ